MPNIGPLEIAIVLVIALVIFGPSRLPELGKSAGKGFREFEDSITGNHDDDDVHAQLDHTAVVEPVDGEVVAKTRA